MYLARGQERKIDIAIEAQSLCKVGMMRLVYGGLNLKRWIQAMSLGVRLLIIVSARLLIGLLKGGLAVGRGECEIGWATKARVARVSPIWHDKRSYIKHLHETSSLYIHALPLRAPHRVILKSTTSYCFVRYSTVLRSHFSLAFTRYVLVFLHGQISLN